MDKRHFIAFLAFVTGDRVQVARLYPEQDASARFFVRGHGWLYAYLSLIHISIQYKYPG